MGIQKNVVRIFKKVDIRFYINEIENNSDYFT